MKMKKKQFFGILLSLLMVLSLLPGMTMTALAEESFAESDIAAEESTVMDETIVENSETVTVDETETETETPSETTETANEAKKAGGKRKMKLAAPSVKLGDVKAEAAEHTHDGITFTEWTSTNSMPTKAGNYYLAGNVTVRSEWIVPEGTVRLCLNGHKITAAKHFKIDTEKTLEIYDSEGGGSIDAQYRVGSMFWVNGGTLVLNGGTINGNVSKAGIVDIAANAIFTMNGGTLTGKAADRYDASGIRFMGSKGTFNMTGGEITGVSAEAGLTYFGTTDVTVKVSGNAKIHDNKTSSGTLRNLYLPSGVTVNVGDLGSGASIGVSMQTPGVFTTGGKAADYASNFSSDNSAYTVQKEGNELKLAEAPASYTVTFNTNGGSAVEAQTVEDGSPATKPADPTRDGYAFDGWYKEEALTNAWDFDGDTVTGDTTLYAKWKKAVSYTVTFKVVNGSWDDGTTAEKPVTLTGYEGDILKLAADQIPAAGSKPEATYKAGSWDVTPDTETEITADTIYTYTYEKKASIEPSVSIDDWAYGETAKTPSVTGNTGNGAVTYTYAKKGTEDFSETVPSEVGEYTVKAVVEETSDYLGGEAVADFAISKADPEPAVISTDNMTGDYETISIEGVAGQEYIIVPKGTEVTEDSWKDAVLSDPERDNWVFFDELSAATEYEIYTRVKETDNYKASEPVKAAVNTSTESVGLDFDSDLVGATIKALPDPEKEGYSYKWYRADRSQNEEETYEDKLTEIEGATGDTYTSTSDDFGKYIIVKVFAGDTEVGDAEFGPIGYGTVTFDSKGGSEVASVTDLAYNSKVKKPADPVKEGFSFAGWYQDEDYTEAWDFNKDTVMWTETTLYAKWVSLDVVYTNTQGANGTWTKGGNKDLQFTFKRSVDDSKTISHFTGILVDGKKVDQKNYTAQMGSVVIKLKSSYLETLAAGKHTLTAQFDDGKDVTVNFTIKAKAADTNKKTTATTTKTGSPATGDPVNLQQLFMLMILSMGVIVAVCIRRRKNVK